MNFLKRWLILFVWIAAWFCFFYSADRLFAQPNPTSTDKSSVSHGDTLVVYSTGLDFGTKSPAAPVWWDDGEGATIDQGPSYMTSGELTWVTSSELSGTDKHYGQVGPNEVTEDSGASNMQYRSSSYSVWDAPHTHSTKIMTGCHDDEGECVGGGNEVGQNVGMGVGDTEYENTWYVRYYVRLSPAWPDISEGNENYKTFNWNTDISNPGGLYAVSNGNVYEVIGGCDNFYNSLGQSPKCYEDYITPAGYSDGSGQQIIDTTDCSGAYSGTYGYPVITYDTGVNNPVNGWIVEERFLDVSDDLFIWRVDNVDAIDTKNVATCSLNSSRIDNGIVGVTIGGFWKGGECNGSDDDLDDSACRAFDDVYIDNTFSRVILGNASTYTACTIIEPQIPSSWSTGEITVTVNAGALTDDSTVYLYVFNSSDEYNATGYPITLAGDGSPTCVISTGSQTIYSDSLSISGTASDETSVSGVKWRIGAAPDEINGTLCTGTTSWTGTATGFSSGSNTLYVGAYDGDGNWGYDSITVTYITGGGDGNGLIISPNGQRLIVGGKELVVQ